MPLGVRNVGSPACFASRSAFGLAAPGRLEDKTRGCSHSPLPRQACLTRRSKVECHIVTEAANSCEGRGACCAC